MYSTDSIDAGKSKPRCSILQGTDVRFCNFGQTILLEAWGIAIIIILFSKVSAPFPLLPVAIASQAETMSRRKLAQSRRGSGFSVGAVGRLEIGAWMRKTRYFTQPDYRSRLMHASLVATTKDPLPSIRLRDQREVCDHHPVVGRMEIRQHSCGPAGQSQPVQCTMKQHEPRKS